MGFKKARREKLIAAVAFMGASGSGKTLGALLTAKGMVETAFPDLSEEEQWEKVAFVDSEHRRALVYVGMEYKGYKIGEYLHLDMQPPYNVDAYDNACRLAKKEGAYVVVLDSITHAWDGEGGLLDLQQSFGGSFQAWRQVNPEYKRFISVITGEKHDIHTLSTMRLKQDYAMTTGDDQKLKVEKLGLKPVQRDSLEYELQVVFSIDMQHVSRPSKDNSGMFPVSGMTIDPSVGEKLVNWLDKGVDVKAEEKKKIADMYEYLVKVAGDDGDFKLAAKLTDLEEKAGMTIETMRDDKPLWLKKAFDLIVNLEKELKAQDESVQNNDEGQDDKAS